MMKVDNRKNDRSENTPHGNSTPVDTILTIVRFVESRCETHPLLCRGYTHQVRGTNTTILSLYQEDYCHDNPEHCVSQTTFYCIFSKHLPHVKIPRQIQNFAPNAPFSRPWTQTRLIRKQEKHSERYSMNILILPNNVKNFIKTWSSTAPMVAVLTGVLAKQSAYKETSRFKSSVTTTGDSVSLMVYCFFAFLLSLPASV